MSCSTGSKNFNNENAEHRGSIRVQIGTVSGLVAQPIIPGVIKGERIALALNVELDASGDAGC